MGKRTFKIYRGDNSSGEMVEYQADVEEGMVVLDVIHRIQTESANDLAVSLPLQELPYRHYFLDFYYHLQYNLEL